MSFTVLGSTGFVGRHLVESLKSKGFDVKTYDLRQVNWLDLLHERDLGHVFYCIGLTADFRKLPFDTVDAHICKLVKILQYNNFDSFTYLSSTRVYESSLTTLETSLISGVSENPDHLYNFSKLMGESLCLTSNEKTKVVRLSNVYGKDFDSQNFLSSVLKDAATNRVVRFLTTPKSSKDYISVLDVVDILPKIALEGVHRLYNVASGYNVTNAQIADVLQYEGISVSFSEDSNHRILKEIDVSRLSAEFGYVGNRLEENLVDLLSYYRLKV